MKTRRHGIDAHCQSPLHASLLEGVDNRIKVMKRMAYGFRDHDYFFLKSLPLARMNPLFHYLRVHNAAGEAAPQPRVQSQKGRK